MPPLKRARPAAAARELARLAAAKAAPFPGLYPKGGANQGGDGGSPSSFKLPAMLEFPRAFKVGPPVALAAAVAAPAPLAGPHPPFDAPTPVDLTRFVCATRSKKRRSNLAKQWCPTGGSSENREFMTLATGHTSGLRHCSHTYSLSSARLCWICSGVKRFMSAFRRRKTCFPMQLLPTNFLEMRMGSQLSSLLRKVRSVVPSVKGNSPALNSWMRRLAYASSSAVHLPRRRGGPFFFPPPAWLLLCIGAAAATAAAAAARACTAATAPFNSDADGGAKPSACAAEWAAWMSREDILYVTRAERKRYD